MHALFVATLLCSVTFVIYNLNVLPRAKMIAGLRLRETSILDAVTGFMKFASTWALARENFGPIALAIPTLFAQAIEAVWTWSRSGISLSGLRVSGPWLKSTFLEMRLPLVMALMVTLNTQTDTLVASAFVPAAAIGLYYFASQLAAQPSNLVGNSLRALFTATTAQVRGDRLKEDASIQVVFSGAMVFMPLVTMAIPAVFQSLERCVWQGKWADSHFPVLLLSATLVYPTALQLVAAPIAGLRDWKLAIRLDALRALAKIVPAAIGGVCILWFELDAAASGLVLAAAVGGASALVSSVELIRILSRTGMPRHTIIYELYATPLAALLSAVATAGLAHSAFEALRAVLGDRAAAGVECVIAATTYSMLAMILLRFGYTATLERLVGALPEFMRTPARRLFVL
jgi:hypothetical protein